MLKPTKLKYLSSFLIVILLLILLFFIHFRFDLTSDRRFSISNQTQNLLHNLEDSISVTLYLTGDLNPGFTRLKKSTADLLEEMQFYTTKKFNIRLVNPSENYRNNNLVFDKLIADGLKPVNVYERDKEGKSIQKIVFPWLVLKYKNKTVNICLLKNVYHKSGEENLNISIENLEYEITNGIRQITRNKINKIAFLEGHGELSEADTWDISKELSHYFQIDRGVLYYDASVLNAYQLIIIAKPQKPFNENEKLIIDQYIMNGGKVIWLIDGVQMAEKDWSTSGLTPAMALDLNLGDMFFKYGVRINSDILEDVQCQTVPVNIAPKGENPQFQASPLLYAPLLLTSPEHPVTKNVSEIRAEICSSIDAVGKSTQKTTTILLATSGNSHVIPVPVNVDLGEVHLPNDKIYFNTGFVPVALLVEGKFESCFANRMLPAVTNLELFREKSVQSKQLFVADGDIIRNETNGIASDTTTMELGYDKYSGVMYGNRDFLINTVLYMTDESDLIQLKSKSLKLRMLNKNLIESNKILIEMLNVGIPIIFLLIAGVFYNFFRKRKYMN